LGMDRENKIGAIWWDTIATADSLHTLNEPQFLELYNRIQKFQYELWKICGRPGVPRPLTPLVP